jgi:hypothetical protein
MATHNGQNKGYGAHHIGVGSPDDTDEPTPPSGLTSSLHEVSAPSWQAPPPTGTFAQPSFTPPPVHTTGSFTSPGFTPPVQPNQVSGSYSSPGFTPPVNPNGPFAQPSYTPAQPSQVAGNYSSPGFVPPTSPTGAYGAVPSVPEQYQNLTGQFSIDLLRQGPQQPGVAGSPNRAPLGEPDTDMRVRYGIWGAVIGAACGAILGLLNAGVEGVPIERGMEPLMLMTIGMMIITSIIFAWFPRSIEAILRQFGLISDDTQ